MNQAQPFPPRMTERQASDYLSINIRTLQNWRLRGSGPAFLKLGRSVRYDRAILDAWMVARVRSNTTKGNNTNQRGED
jgi:hypothetical protein